MTLIDRHRASVLFIDMQDRLVPEVDLGDLVASMCERLMAWLGDQQAGVVVTEHYVDKLGNTVFLKSLRRRRVWIILHFRQSKSIRFKLLHLSGRLLCVGWSLMSVCSRP